MKIVFFNRGFFPDSSATSQILSDLAFHLAAAGRDVHVVTSHLAEGSPDFETVRGVTVHRVARSSAGSHGVLDRARAYWGYYVGARRAARELLGHEDVAVLKTDPPLLSSAIASIATSRGSSVVVWLQDLFPEVAKEYGIAGMGGLSGAMLRRSRNRSLAMAKDVVAIADSMATHIRSQRCVAMERLHVIHNWADGASIVPMERNAAALRGEWGLGEDFVVVYSGNLGRVHEFETILDAAARLRNQRIRFVFIGRGPRLLSMQARVTREKLANVQFRPLQERERLSESLSIADVHLSVLRPEFEGLVHPSKLYGIMAAGRPTIFVGKVTGETAQILARAQAGLSIATGDSEGLAVAILRLRDDPSERQRMGENARRAFESEYDMPIALAKWERLLSSI